MPRLGHLRWHALFLRVKKYAATTSSAYSFLDGSTGHFLPHQFPLESSQIFQLSKQCKPIHVYDRMWSHMNYFSEEFDPCAWFIQFGCLPCLQPVPNQETVSNYKITPGVYLGPRQGVFHTEWSACAGICRAFPWHHFLRKPFQTSLTLLLCKIEPLCMHWSLRELALW